MNRKAIRTVLILFAALALLLTGLAGCKKNPPVETTKDITISGKVMWGGTENAVANATVIVGTALTTTAANGTFQLKITIPAAGLTGTLTVTHAQCVPFSQSISTTADLTVSNISITRLNHVDGTAGNDATADGTAGKPYKTITAALAVDGWVTAQLAEGTYQEGETFPLILGENDTISGNITDGPTIQFTSDVIHVVGNGAKISEVIINEQDFAAEHTAINLGPSGVTASLTVERCTFYRWYQVLLSGANASLDICDSLISDNTLGIQFNGAAGTHFSIHGSTISNNNVGMQITGTGACNFGTEAIPGENNFRSNSIVALRDFRPANSGALYAVGNTWSSATMPSVADNSMNASGGTDFYIAYSGNTIIFSEE